MSELPPHDDDALAGEVALGVLDGEERAAADRRRLVDPAFAAAVDAWSTRLGRIAEDEAADRAPPTHLWDRIARRIAAEGEGAVVALRRSLAAWRAATAGAGALAAALAVALYLRPAPPPVPVPALAPAPTVSGMAQAASLSTATGGKVAFVAVLDPERGELVLTPASISGLPGKSPKLWVIPTGGKPISLGVAQFGKPVRLRVRDLVGGDRARTLAVTLEPQGGSPSGAPTGPVIASGQLQAL